MQAWHRVLPYAASVGERKNTGLAPGANGQGISSTSAQEKHLRNSIGSEKH
jgi:hypothetical protein